MTERIAQSDSLKATRARGGMMSRRGSGGRPSRATTEGPVDSSDEFRRLAALLEEFSRYQRLINGFSSVDDENRKAAERQKGPHSGHHRPRSQR